MNRLLYIVILFFTTVIVSAQEPVPTDSVHPYFKKRMDYFAQNPIGYDKIVFLGNSLTEGGKWNEYFPKSPVVNRGIVGDNTKSILTRLDEIVQYQPRVLFVLAGVNDMSMNMTNEEILDNFRSIIQRIKSESPRTKIYVESALPFNNDFGKFKKLIGKEEQLLDYNKALKKLCKKEKVKFLNIYPKFKDKEGKLKKEITNDGLHLNDAGYVIWVKAIKKYVPVY